MPRPRAERAISIHAPQWGATILGGLLQQSGINFNPRTPVGCDPLTYASCICQNVFQSTHPSGVRLISRSSSRSSREFQSTHPSGVRLVWSLPGISRCRFQSTHPSGVRHHTTTRRSNDQRYFNPRTPVGCDRVSRAWTCVGWRFQSTHPSGVRRQVNNNCLVSGVFQSTHPSGVRLYHDAATAYCRLISIHAPQWGATLRWSKRFTSSTRFQSTHPSGVRPSFWFPVGLADDFNPRTPVGCDIASLKEAQSIWISIHAPQWGATSGAPASARCVEFQSTHPSGVRQLT